MKRGQEILSLPVVELTTGEELGIVKDVAFDSYSAKVLGFIVSKKGKREAIIPFMEAHGLGPHAITVETREVLDPFEDNQAETLRGESHRILGGRVLTAGGVEQGTIVDIVFDESSGRITGYELSGGLIADLAHGRRFLPADHPMDLGQDAIIIDDGIVQPFPPLT